MKELACRSNVVMGEIAIHFPANLTFLWGTVGVRKHAQTERKCRATISQMLCDTRRHVQVLYVQLERSAELIWGRMAQMFG
jgi:hypothetical protein